MFAKKSVVLYRALFFPLRTQGCGSSALWWGAQGGRLWLGLRHSTITDISTTTLSALLMPMKQEVVLFREVSLVPASAQSNESCPCLLLGCWTRWSYKVPPSPNHSVILSSGATSVRLNCLVVVGLCSGACMRAGVGAPLMAITGALGTMPHLTQWAEKQFALLPLVLNRKHQHIPSWWYVERWLYLVSILFQSPHQCCSL